MVKVLYNKKQENVEATDNMILADLAEKFQSEIDSKIVLGFINGKLSELTKSITNEDEVSFVTIKDPIGFETYRRSLLLLMLKAAYDVGRMDISVMYSIKDALYCEPNRKKAYVLDDDFIDAVKNRMEELISQDITIEKENLSTDQVVKLFKERKMVDKEQLFKYRRVSKANIYSLDGYIDYFYGYMVPSTGYLKKYNLFLYENGFMLQMPNRKNPEQIDEFVPQKQLFKVLKQAERWGDMIEVGTVGALNDLVTKGGMNEMVLVAEALMEKNIGDIAKKIMEQKKKIVLIAGPSSSGKTTFSHRLSIQLRANGLKPHPIAMDNYFVNREQTPKDEFGNYNFECIDAIDIKQFNEDMSQLVAGKEVEISRFNFKTGQREYKGDFKQLGSDDVLVIEGIHGLNPKMSESLKSEDKFKIYISALTQLNIDEHNRIPTTDGRLIRRIVRDAQHRGTSAKDTIAMWASVRRGEEENIFPYQENADAMFNSALIYELAVLKQYAEPLLFAIPKDCKEYLEAKRLLKFFDYFLGITSTNIPINSIIREFIGGSCFDV